MEIVRWMYRMFVEERMLESRFAKMLNERGITADLGRAWTQGTIHQILTNGEYDGNNIYNRMSFKLKKKRVLNPPEMWIYRGPVSRPEPGIWIDWVCGTRITGAEQLRPSPGYSSELRSTA